MSETSYKTFMIRNNKLCSIITKDFNLEKYNLPRQKYHKTYEANGIIDIYKTEIILKGKLLGNKVYPFITEEFNSEIDSHLDFNLVELYMKQKKLNFRL